MSNASVPNGNGGSGNGHRRAEQPRSWLQPFLLLALEQWQSHGYELIRRMSAFGFETLDRGSVYRTLRQLEKDGLVTSGWDTSKDGPARRLYTLTDAGRALPGGLRRLAARLPDDAQPVLQPVPVAVAHAEATRGRPSRRRRRTAPPSAPSARRAKGAGGRS